MFVHDIMQSIRQIDECVFFGLHTIREKGQIEYNHVKRWRQLGDSVSEKSSRAIQPWNKYNSGFIDIAIAFEFKAHIVAVVTSLVKGETRNEGRKYCHDECDTEIHDRTLLCNEVLFIQLLKCTEID